MVDITVVMPVGPHQHDVDYIQEAVESLNIQTHKPKELLIVDDMAYPYELSVTNYPVTIHYNDWRMGVAHSFNIGVARAHTECVLMMGADDWLEPDCLEECERSYKEQKDIFRAMCYYWLGVRYSDGQGDQFLPCHAAMVTKALWRATGGLPVEAASGASDAAFISMLLGNKGVARLVGVNESRPLYNYRVHEHTDTSKKAAWQGVILETRNLVTREFSVPEWGRYE